LVEDVVEAIDELIRFWKSRGQGRGRCKVRFAKWVIVSGESIHIDFWASKYHLVFFETDNVRLLIYCFYLTVAFDIFFFLIALT